MGCFEDVEGVRPLRSRIMSLKTTAALFQWVTNDEDDESVGVDGVALIRWLMRMKDGRRLE